MSDRKEIILYFNKSEPFKELFLNSNVISKRFGSIIKETDSTWTIEFIHKLGIEIYQNLIGRKFDESKGIHQIFTQINEYFKQSFKINSDPFYKVLEKYWLILTDIVQRNQNIHLDKNVIVTIEDIKRILNLSLLIRFHLDKYLERLS